VRLTVHRSSQRVTAQKPGALGNAGVLELLVPRDRALGAQQREGALAFGVWTSSRTSGSASRMSPRLRVVCGVACMAAVIAA
jgi:hypothetical protein